MDDIRDQMDLANEISNAISQPVNFGLEFDDEDLNAELELLEQEELDSKLLDTGDAALAELEDAPSVPTTAIPGNLENHTAHYLAIAQPPRPLRTQKVEDDEDAELAELKASMAL
jgi:charged multivesicular body protein 4